MSVGLPHAGVVTRLGVSAIHGIGVFAIGSIAQGRKLFEDDRAELRWVDASEVDAADLSEAHRSLYRDFAVRRGGKLGCPDSFDLLTPGWYLNQPAPGDLPNVTASADLGMVAARDIAAGEELTVDYVSFSER